MLTMNDDCDDFSIVYDMAYKNEWSTIFYTNKGNIYLYIMYHIHITVYICVIPLRCMNWAGSGEGARMLYMSKGRLGNKLYTLFGSANVFFLFYMHIIGA